MDDNIKLNIAKSIFIQSRMNAEFIGVVGLLVGLIQDPTREDAEDKFNAFFESYRNNDTLLNSIRDEIYPEFLQDLHTNKLGIEFTKILKDLIKDGMQPNYEKIFPK